MSFKLPPTECHVLISCDTSDIAMNGVIWEQIEPVEDLGTTSFNRKCTPISFFSQLLTNSQQNWPRVQTQLYAILLMLTENGFENYLKKAKIDERVPKECFIVPKCPSCQKTAAVSKLHVPTDDLLWADKSFAKVNIDVIVSLYEDQDGYKYILVSVNSFSRSTIIAPLKKINANLSAEAFIWKICAIFGIPFVVYSDNGPEYLKAVFDSLCEFLGMEVSNSAPHLCQFNGVVERRHRDFLYNLRKLVVDSDAYDA
ncbi:hypothetical protein P9112_002517 [Eukaryota sp. TZLM1-RC]